MSDLLKLFDEVISAAKKDDPTMPELYTSILNPSGPNYEHWFHIFGHNQVPLKSPHSVKADLGDPVTEKDVEVYLLNLAGMTLKQKARLLGFIAQKFQVPVSEVEKQIAREGFPIRAVDVIVGVSMRAIV